MVQEGLNRKNGGQGRDREGGLNPGGRIIDLINQIGGIGQGVDLDQEDAISDNPEIPGPEIPGLEIVAQAEGDGKNLIPCKALRDLLLLENLPGKK